MQSQSSYLRSGFRPAPVWNISNLKSEFLIPDEVSRIVNEGKASLKLLETPSVWYGVTYKEDKPSVVKALKRLTDQGLYKPGLY